MRLTLIFVAAVLVATPILAGCINKADPVQPAGGATSGAGEVITTPNLPPKVMRTPIPASVTTSAVWIQPGDTVQLTATSPAATSYAWYLQLRAAVSAPASAGCSHSMASWAATRACMDVVPVDDSARDCATIILDPGACGTTAPPPPNTPKFDTGLIASGSSKSIKVDKPGFYMIHCHPHPWMTFNLTVDAKAPTGDKMFTIVDGASKDEYRFAPDESTVAPGSLVTFQNAGSQQHSATMHAFLTPLTVTGKSPSYKADTMGDFDVIIIAKDNANGAGLARTRLLVDPSKPSETQPIGPYKGTFNASAPVPNNPQAETKDFSFTLPFPAKSITINVKSTSQTPAPTMVHATLKKQGDSGIAATMASADKGVLTATNLLDGVYTLSIVADQGVLIDYTADGTAILDLTPPPAMDMSMAGMNHKM